MIKKSLDESPRYRGFTQDRDRALERLLHKTQLKVSDTLRGALTRALEIVSHQYSQIPENFFFTQNSLSILKSIETSLDRAFAQSIAETLEHIYKLRRYSYLLAIAGEVEALSRSTGNPLKLFLSKEKLDQEMLKKNPNDEYLTSRITLAYSRIKRDILDALELSRVMESPLNDTIDRVKATFPRQRRVIRPKKTVGIREASKPRPEREVTLSDFFIDDAEWTEMVDEYKSEFIPEWRTPDPERDRDLMEEEGVYTWEIEQEVTHDFVQNVREGYQAGMDTGGISDFQWISIVDDKTDECCVWRDGLLTSEIEAELKGNRSDDECQVIVPPAHFNCRCRLVPFTEDLPEVPPQHLSEFDEWLTGKKK